MTIPSFDKKIPVMSIPEIFEGKSVFITGGSGFIGRVLIEKLLRTCPGLKHIYILMRPKNNKSIQERITALLNVPLFDQLRAGNEEVLQKVLGVTGDVSQINLGLNDQDTMTLIENVSIIYHMAASVRFDDHLKKAILMNTRGTREIISLAKQCKTLDVFVYCSTAFTNYLQDVVEEKVYAPKQDWRMAIELAENYEEMIFQVLTEKCIHPCPNTYTYTKGLAEQAVVDLCTNQIPAIIVRPSIVLPTYEDPFGGWVDNFNGPMMYNLLAGKGVLKVLYMDKQVIHDHVFVDNLAKVMIIAAWRKSIMSSDKSIIEVYNTTSDANFSPEFDEITAQKAVPKNPSSSFIWTVGVFFVKNQFVFYILTLINHLLPALVLDSIARLTGRKAMMVKLYRKIFIANLNVHPFMMKEINFRTDNYVALEECLMERDKKSLSFNNARMTKQSTQLSEVIAMLWAGLKANLMNENSYATETEHKRYMRITSLQKMVFLAVKGWIAYLVISKFFLPLVVSEFNKILTK